MNWRDLKPGDRIRLLEMPNDPNPIEAGTEGTVTMVNDLSRLMKREDYQIFVQWDNGRTLSIVPIDKWEKIDG